MIDIHNFDLSQSAINFVNREDQPKSKNYDLVCFILYIFFTLLIYYIYVYEAIWKFLSPANINSSAILLVIFHILLILMELSAYMIYSVDPGTVNSNIAFYTNRICVLCKVFKQDRTFHCNFCNKCILVKHHHCYLLCTCIGFYNRKFFVQFVFYLCLLLIDIDITLGKYAFHLINNIFRKKLKYGLTLHATLIISCYIGVFLLSLIMILYLFGQIKMILHNVTFTELMIKDNKEDLKKYCLTKRENWEQVFGKNVLLWFLPINLESGKPVGDGIRFQTQSNIISQERNKQLENMLNKEKTTF